MKLVQDGNSTKLELLPPNSRGNSRITFKKGNGDYWDILGINNHFFQV